MEAKLKEVRKCLSTLVQAEQNLKNAKVKFTPIRVEVLKRFNFTDDEGKPIEKVEDLYLCEDEEAIDRFYNELHIAYTEAGAILEDVGYCPICIADTDFLTAKSDFVSAALELMKMKFPEEYGKVTFQMLTSQYNNYQKFYELTRKLFTETQNNG